MNDVEQAKMIIGFGGLAVGFLLGSALTYIVNRVTNKKGQTLGLNDFIAIIVIFIWSFAMISDVVVPDYTIDIGIHIITGAIVGALFNVKIDIPSRLFKFENKQDDKNKSKQSGKS